MKKSLQILIVLVFLCGISEAQTNVSGVISTNTTWDLAGSPYIVTADVTVAAYVRLTIAPGVAVKFEDGKQLYVASYGIIRAIGTVTDSITFTSNSNSPHIGSWYQIYALNTCPDSIFFNYCNFRYARIGLNYIANDRSYLKNSNFSNDSVGLETYSATYKFVDSCAFTNNNTGCYNDWTHLRNCTAINNLIGIEAIDGIEENCVIKYNQTGIFINNNATLKNCVIDSNTNFGINKAWYNTGHDSILNCQINHNMIGMNFSNAYVFISGCIFEYDSIGVYFYGTNLGVSCYIHYTQMKYDNIGLQIDNTLDTLMNSVFENDSIGIIFTLQARGRYISCNKICNNFTSDVYTTSFYYDNNMTNNYWCTTDTNLIHSRITGSQSMIVYVSPVDSLQCYQSFTTTVNEISFNPPQISLYPNPTTGTFALSYHLSTPDVVLQLLDISGRVVYKQSISGSIGNEIIDASALISGMYFWQLTSATETWQGKVFVEK